MYRYSISNKKEMSCCLPVYASITSHAGPLANNAVNMANILSLEERQLDSEYCQLPHLI